MDRYCVGCANLNYEEEIQDVLKKIKDFRDHKCLKYNQRLKHDAPHENILRLDKCIIENSKDPI